MGNLAYVAVLAYAGVKYVETFDDRFAWIAIAAFIVPLPFYVVSLLLGERWPLSDVALDNHHEPSGRDAMRGPDKTDASKTWHPPTPHGPLR